MIIPENRNKTTTTIATIREIIILLYIYYKNGDYSNRCTR